jgi:hypothetical protein
MKRFFYAALITLVAGIVLPNPASASLYEGSWSSSLGQIQTGSWAMIYHGSDPANLGSILNMQSNFSTPGMSWFSTGSTVTSYTQTGYIPTSNGGFYIDGTKTYSGGTFRFRFSDGTFYSFNDITESSTLRMYFDSSYKLLSYALLEYQGSGIIKEDPNFKMTVTSTPSSFSSGKVDNLLWDIKAVPIPASLWILGSGLLGLLGIRRRIRA